MELLEDVPDFLTEDEDPAPLRIREDEELERETGARKFRLLLLLDRVLLERLLRELELKLRPLFPPNLN